MIRAVADTNVFISAIIFGGLPGEFLNLAITKSIKLIVSPILLDELDRKLRLKFQFSPEKAALLQINLLNIADNIVPQNKIDAVPSDPDDNRVLECTVEGAADFIVSGDRHLLSLGWYQSIQILTVRQFIDRVIERN